MTIFVWFLLVTFVVWFIITNIGIIAVLLKSEYYEQHRLSVGKVLFNMATPFIGIGACIGYLFG